MSPPAPAGDPGGGGGGGAVEGGGENPHDTAQRRPPPFTPRSRPPPRPRACTRAVAAGTDAAPALRGARPDHPQGVLARPAAQPPRRRPSLQGQSCPSLCRPPAAPLRYHDLLERPADTRPPAVARPPNPLRAQCQGVTLERVVVDVGGSWEPGQAYVALSRATSLGGLELVSPVGSPRALARPVPGGGGFQCGGAGARGGAYPSLSLPVSGPSACTFWPKSAPPSRGSARPRGQRGVRA